MVGNLGKYLLQLCVGLGTDFDQGKAGIGSFLADADILDEERAAARSDAIQDFGQDEAVDYVAADLDVFDGAMLGGIVIWSSFPWSQY